MENLIRQRSKCGILDSGGGYVMTFPLDSRQMIGVGACESWRTPPTGFRRVQA